MGNPLMEMMGGAPAAAKGTPKMNNGAMQSIKRMMNMYNAAKDPQVVLQEIANQVPMINGIMQIGSQNGGLQNTFYTMCKEQGVDPNTILNELRS